MTETVETTATPAPAEAPEAPKPTPEQILAGLDEFGQLGIRRLIEDVEKYNALASQIQALSGDKQALLENLRETSEHPEVVQLREVISKVQDKLFQLEENRDNILKAEIDKIQAESGEEVEKLQAQADEMLKLVKAARNYANTAWPEAISLVPKLVRAAKSSGGGQTGVRRIRHRSWTIVKEGQEAVTKDNATAAAGVLQTDTGKLQEAFFKAAGGSESKDWADEVSFEYGDAQVTVRKSE